MQINSINSQYKTNNLSKRKYTDNAVPSKNNYNPSFNGIVPTPVVNGLSNFYEGVAKNSIFQNAIKKFSLSDRTFTHLLVMESCLLSGFYMINTIRNKKIDKEQKPQMLINDTLTLGVSTAGAYLAEDKITDVVMKQSEKYFANHKDFYTKLGKQAQEQAENAPIKELISKVGEVSQLKGAELKQGIDDVTSMVGTHLKDLVAQEGQTKAFQIKPEELKAVQTSVSETISKNMGNADKAKEAVKGVVSDVYNSAAARKEADKIIPGINKVKVLVIFGLIYRYLGPVVITPIANKISSKLLSAKNEKQEKNQNIKN